MPDGEHDYRRVHAVLIYHGNLSGVTFRAACWSAPAVLKQHSHQWQPRTASRFRRLTGTPKVVVNEAERWIDEADVGGFNLVQYRLAPAAGAHGWQLCLLGKQQPAHAFDIRDDVTDRRDTGEPAVCRHERLSSGRVRRGGQDRVERSKTRAFLEQAQPFA
jgi:hypothetical protein